jgi:hypothetical protein
MSNLIVAVDFDKCLIEEIPSLSTNYTLKPNARNTINKLSSLGVEFILNTSRYGWYYDSAVEFIRSEKLNIHVQEYEHKVPADVYIDDCNIFCQYIDWYEIESELLRLLERKTT